MAATAKTTKCNGRLNRPKCFGRRKRGPGAARAPEIHARRLVGGHQRAAVTLGQDPDALHVALGFLVRRHAVVLVDRALAGVVAGRGEGQVAVEALQQPGQVLHATLDVLPRSEEHTSELQSLMRISYAV